MLSLAILVSADGFDFIVRTTTHAHRQTDRITDAADRYNATIVGVVIYALGLRSDTDTTKKSIGLY